LFCDNAFQVEKLWNKLKTRSYNKKYENVSKYLIGLELHRVSIKKRATFIF